jgi:hypothetical protein
MIAKTKPQTKRSAEAQRRKNIREFKQLDEEYQTIKKDIDVIEAETARRLEAYRNLHGIEMRRFTDEYQRASRQYRKYVLDPVEIINCYKAGVRRELKKKLEPYHKKLALHPGRPMTEDEVFISHPAHFFAVLVTVRLKLLSYVICNLVMLLFYCLVFFIQQVVMSNMSSPLKLITASGLRHCFGDHDFLPSMPMNFSSILNTSSSVYDCTTSSATSCDPAAREMICDNSAPVAASWMLSGYWNRIDLSLRINAMV